MCYQVIKYIVSRLLGVVLVVCLASVAGCTVGPDFEAPQIEVPDEWVGPTAVSTTGSTESVKRNLAEWWVLFQDPVLTSLVERAVESNLDIKLAQARVRQARAARGIATSSIGPAVNTSGSFRRSKSPGPSGGSAGANADEEGPTVNQYQVGFDAGWELDIVG
ncbi:MAG: TolC family protein, partial [Phycisphaeraceae bacterium]|nr:TolC family protein [Phycisphaeraceae bacterium]